MDPVNTEVSFPELEEKILEFWKENKIFERTLDPRLPTSIDGKTSDKPRPDYIFYDGPPFATGLPHYGHLLAGTIKDVIGRFFTMKGFHVDRRFGWDCHGVPVEFEIQKSLNLYGAKAIREFGVANFNEECRQIVLRYTKEWEAFVERSGRWVDFSRQYRTMDLDFMESIWWVVKRLWDRGLIYEGFKCVPYSPAINTPLSNFEVNLNYKDVQDPAITIRAKVLDDLSKFVTDKSVKPSAVYAYVWTTTPWTLPSNMAFAVGAEIEYSLVKTGSSSELVLLASNLLGEYFPELAEKKKKDAPAGDAVVVGKVLGKDLEGVQYEPFFSYFEEERARSAFRFYVGDFVSADDGTGIVHCASFGEDDLKVFLEHNIKVVDPVDEDGKFTDAVPEFAGLMVKDADAGIIATLKKSGKLVSHKTIVHSYPFCYRTDTPLIYKSISSWFVNVEAIRDLLIQNNSNINWVPSHIKEGRFGKWLEGARDWAISRNRFWGTPIPIWKCTSCKKLSCIGSVEELEERTGAKVTDLHSHFIDHLEMPCKGCGSVMKRIPDVLDCWFESGSMPYAQAHYPFENKEEFDSNFPADFIAEGLDQTRGWFYTLLVLSTALFGRTSFKNVIVNGILLAEDGKKMSKSLKNYPPPNEVMDEIGSDAMRLYLLSSAATRAEDLRFSKTGVTQVVRQTMLPLWNAYNFFVTYALVDGWTPNDAPKEPSPNLLDRWMMSKVASLVQAVDTVLSSYHLYLAAPPILEFVEQLTNWYIRLNRRRFWAGNSGDAKSDKFHAYNTLHQSLLTFVRVLAPLAPFISEEIFRNLSKGVSSLSFESVHLAPFPSLSELSGVTIDSELEEGMDLFEEVILLGRSLRNEHGLKLRQPLASMTVIHAQEDSLKKLSVLDSYLKDELNVKNITYSTDESELVNLSARLNTKKLGGTLGPKLGAQGMQQLRAKVEALSTKEISSLERGGNIEILDVSPEVISLGADDLIIERKIKTSENASATSGQITIMLDTNLSQELRVEGLAREFVNRVQKLRKEFGFDVSDRILTQYMTACPRLTAALEEHRSYIMEETLAIEMSAVKNQNEFTGNDKHRSAQEVENKMIIISLNRIQS
jgi:isoleucyl-tRNA synthetase